MVYDKEKLKTFPTDPGVYLMRDEVKRVIYVGKAKNLRSRVKQYFSKHPDSRAMIPHLIAQVEEIETVVTPSEREALLLENTLIKKHKPKYNALLKDDKTFIGIEINIKHEWPRVTLVRSRSRPKKKTSLYFGPYTSAFSARQTVDLINRLFPLRECSDGELARRKRPCILHDMKRCIAPCVSKCTKGEYDTYVKGARSFIQGKDHEILKELKAKMKEASEKMQYERAGAYLQTIRQIEHVIASETLVVGETVKNADAIGLYRRADEVVILRLMVRDGKLIASEPHPYSDVVEESDELLERFILEMYAEATDIPPLILLPKELSQREALEELLREEAGKKVELNEPQRGRGRKLKELAEQNAAAHFKSVKDHEALKEKQLLDLKETLKLTRYPKRIECFDVSNISGTDPVASLVRFSNGSYDKSGRRLFKLKSAKPGDDYGALEEALTRRLQNADDELPDLILVDGGKGQLGVAKKVFEALSIASIDLASVVKDKGRHDKGMSAERVYLPTQKEAIPFAHDSQLLFLLQRIRDEAHRVAISFHRQRRSKRTLTSELDLIPGIGPKRKTELLRAFGSVEAIKHASKIALLKVHGVSEREADTIFNHFH